MFGRHCQPESGVPAKDAVAINLGVILFGLARSVSEPMLIVDHFQQRNRGGPLCQMTTPVTTTEKSPDENGLGRGERSPDQSRLIHMHPSGDDADFPAGDRNMASALDCGEAESAIGIARRICQLGSHNIDEQTTSAIPGHQASSGGSLANSATGQRIPISSILRQPFPPMELVHSLLEDYFDAIHWFSLAVYEPKFRKSLCSIADGYAYPSQRPFLVLLAIMLAMASWYRSQKSCADPADNTDYMEKLSADLLGLVESNVVELMDQPSITSAQTCILLGSHHVYHGRPNLSFSLLGATIKMSQSLGMHRGLGRGDFENIEERKRVWWTIYTWDRFASITYGRPLGINDKDCNLDMPADVFENPKFVAPATGQASPICYSTYQRELNQLYLIASPALKTVFGSRTLRASEQLNGDTYFALVRHATENLQKWRSCLPNHLALDLNRDFDTDDRPSARAHALQSLSLQLTYDNVLIVLHRPLLARQVDHLYTVNTQSPEGSRTDNLMYHPNTTPSVAQSNLPSNSAFPNTQTTSPDLWMNAAKRTSRVTEMPTLAQLATDSHLGAFLAINLFNAAIVLAVMALSEPLSDTAQEMKRTITRILRLQDLLGRRFALSKQSTAVLKNVAIMLLRRESAAMLAPITGTSQVMGHQPLQTLADPSLISVEDTLRMPLDAAWDSRDPLAKDQRLPDLSRADRLNNSLTSVQYALGPGDRSGIPTGGENLQFREFVEPGIQTHEVWQPAEYDWSMPGLAREPLENTHQDSVEGGLYWLWDMTWNGVGG
ncbi:transcriptional regulator family: Fungal Specific TF [Penicillium robsamsonii]|uniref:transcriptional regulator family: Fungal Specific TF n=1 Tax=Penicillium robsamsonii TaxID=1792511 RepID=UPI002548F8ED|nr:transcriptional regulator family: Fungal Specific TF [Penicillium robsamsonii]KAJ5813021.1 transcriptional regulator family: Fungal Specific TF [Penicillium robsamsonii]